MKTASKSVAWLKRRKLINRQTETESDLFYVFMLLRKTPSKKIKAINKFYQSKINLGCSTKFNTCLSPSHVEKWYVTIGERLIKPQIRRFKKIYTESERLFWMLNEKERLFFSYRHFLTVLGGPKFHCQRCGKSYKYPNGLARHKRECGQEKRYQCSICHSKHHRKDNLRSHVLLVHKMYHLDV